MNDHEQAAENAQRDYSLTAADDLIEKLEDAIRKLFRNIGQRDRCRGCRADIVWVTHLNGKKTPYDPDTAVSHFITCPNAKEFKK